MQSTLQLATRIGAALQLHVPPEKPDPDYSAGCIVCCEWECGKPWPAVRRRARELSATGAPLQEACCPAEIMLRDYQPNDTWRPDRLCPSPILLIRRTSPAARCLPVRCRSGLDPKAHFNIGMSSPFGPPKLALGIPAVNSEVREVHEDLFDSPCFMVVPAVKLSFVEESLVESDKSPATAIGHRRKQPEAAPSRVDQPSFSEVNSLGRMPSSGGPCLLSRTPGPPPFSGMS